MKHKRIRAKIPELLESGPLNTHEIYDLLKEAFPKTAPQMHALTNILAKNKSIRPKIHCSSPDAQRVLGNSMYSYSITTWELVD